MLPIPGAVYLDYETFLSKYRSGEIVLHVDNMGSLKAAQANAFPNGASLVMFYVGVLGLLGSIVGAFVVHWALPVLGLVIMKLCHSASTSMRNDAFTKALLENKELYNVSCKYNFIWLTKTTKFGNQGDADTEPEDVADSQDEDDFYDGTSDSFVKCVIQDIRRSSCGAQFSKLIREKAFASEVNRLINRCWFESLSISVASHMVQDSFYREDNLQKICERLQHQTKTLRECQNHAEFCEKFYRFSPDEYDNRKYFDKGVKKAQLFINANGISADPEIVPNFICYAIAAQLLREYGHKQMALNNLCSYIGYHLLSVRPEEAARTQKVVTGGYQSGDLCLVSHAPPFTAELHEFDELSAKGAKVRCFEMLNGDIANEESFARFEAFWDSLESYLSEEFIPRLYRSDKR